MGALDKVLGENWKEPDREEQYDNLIPQEQYTEQQNQEKPQNYDKKNQNHDKNNNNKQKSNKISPNLKSPNNKNDNKQNKTKDNQDKTHKTLTGAMNKLKQNEQKIDNQNGKKNNKGELKQDKLNQDKPKTIKKKKDKTNNPDKVYKTRTGGTLNIVRQKQQETETDEEESEIHTEEIEDLEENTNLIDFEDLDKYNPTKDKSGIVFELYHPLKKLHFLMTFWKQSTENKGSTLGALEVNQAFIQTL